MYVIAWITKGHQSGPSGLLRGQHKEKVAAEIVQARNATCPHETYWVVECPDKKKGKAADAGEVVDDTKED